MSDQWQPATSVSYDLALAVVLTDSVAGGQPSGDPVVRVAESDERPIRTKSGHYLFFDLPEKEVTVTADAGDQYRNATKTADLDPAGGARDTGTPFEVPLKPTPAYEFPSGLTRVRGTVLDGTTPVPGATVSVAVPGHSRTVETTDAGEFVHYFDVNASTIERYDPDPNDPTNPVERRYKPGGSHPEFTVDGDPGTFTENVVVVVGTCTTYDLNYQSNP